jgi:hypothetical protein
MAMLANVEEGSVTKRIVGKGHAHTKRMAWISSRPSTALDIMVQRFLDVYSTRAPKSWSSFAYRRHDTYRTTQKSTGCAS